jgi:hypothetical protein
VASFKSWLRIPLNAGKMGEYAKWLYLSANGAVLSAKVLGGRGNGKDAGCARVDILPIEPRSAVMRRLNSLKGREP